MLFPDCGSVVSKRPRCARLKFRPARTEGASVGLENGDDLEAVLAEAPAPDPLEPRYVVREVRRTVEKNILADSAVARCLLKSLLL
jgi:hypothetical protein